MLTLRIYALAGSFLALVLTWALPVHAGEADVRKVDVTAEPGGAFKFDVTVAHADAGWEHYADKWDVLGADGTIYATRVLAHPHDDEQPFTRSQGGVAIPEGIRTVTVRAHDLVHGYGGREMIVELPGR
jgi:hypothetical protein